MSRWDQKDWTAQQIINSPVQRAGEPRCFIMSWPGERSEGETMSALITLVLKDRSFVCVPECTPQKTAVKPQPDSGPPVQRWSLF